MAGRRVAVVTSVSDTEVGRIIRLRLYVQCFNGFPPLESIPMESKVAKDAQRSLLEAMQRLTAEERLNAFLTHCRLMMDLQRAGQQMRAAHSQKHT